MLNFLRTIVRKTRKQGLIYMGEIIRRGSTQALFLELTSLVPRPYFFLLLSLFIHNKSLERHSEAAKKEMGVQLRKSKAWFGKSRDPQGFL